MSFPEQNQVSDWKFLEIWVDPTASPPYVLMLFSGGSGGYHIIDPAEAYTVIFSNQSYEETRLWLLEDEYERVEGRLFAEFDSILSEVKGSEVEVSKVEREEITPQYVVYKVS